MVFCYAIACDEFFDPTCHKWQDGDVFQILMGGVDVVEKIKKLFGRSILIVEMQENAERNECTEAVERKHGNLIARLQHSIHSYIKEAYKKMQF